MANKLYDKEDTDKDFFDVVNSSISPNAQKALEGRAVEGAAKDIAGNTDEGISKFQNGINSASKDEAKSLYKNDAPIKKKSGGIRAAASKRKKYIAAGGIAGTLIGGAMSFLVGVLPFELSYIKNVLTQEIGGIQATVLETRSGRLYSRAFFFDEDQKFSGFKSRGVIATLTGENFRSDRLINDLEAKGFKVTAATGPDGKFTGRFESIQLGDEIYNDPASFREAWNQKKAVRGYLTEAYPQKSWMWRSRNARLLYSRYNLGPLRSDWWAKKTANKIDDLRLRMKSRGRQALFGDIGTPDVNGTIEVSGDDGAVLETKDLQDGTSAEADRLKKSLLDDPARIKAPIPDAGDVLSGSAKAAGGVAARTVGVLGSVDAACQIKRLLTVVEVGARSARALALIKYTGLFLSMADVAITGQVDAQDLGQFTSFLSRQNPDTGRDFFGSGSWQYASRGGNGTVNDNIRNKYSTGGGLTGKLIGINGAIDSAVGKGNANSTCKFVTNPFIQVGSFAAGVAVTGFTLGVYAAVKIGASVLLEGFKFVAEAILVPMIIDMVAGTVITFDEWGDESAAALVSGYGATIALQGSNFGLAPVTTTQVAAIKQEQEVLIALDNKDKNFIERYASLSNHRSLASTMLYSLPSSYRSVSSSFANFIRSPLSLFSSSTSGFSFNRAYATASGSTQCSDEDILSNRLAADPFCNVTFALDVPTLAVDPYDNFISLYNAGQVDEEGAIKPGSELAEHALNCQGAFDVIHDYEEGDFESSYTNRCFIGRNALAIDGTYVAFTPQQLADRQNDSYSYDDLYAMDASPEDAESGKVYAQTNLQAAEELQNRVVSDVQRYNLAILDTALLDSMEEDINGTFGGTLSGSNITAAGEQIDGDPYTDTTSVACHPETRDLGIHDGYTKGNKVPVRLCALPNISSTSSESVPGGTYYIDGANGDAIVNSRMSGAWHDLTKTAAEDGITFSARSSYRTMQHQRDLCNANSLCRNGTYTYVASPGGSSHQAGVAIDFANMGVKGGSGCETRATSSNEGYVWLKDNASRWGIKQYAREAWHWDAAPLSNRC